MEKVMNFVIRRQGVFAENLERLEGAEVRIAERVGGLTDTVSVLVRAQTQLVESRTRMRKDIAFLARSVTDLTKEVRGQ